MAVQVRSLHLTDPLPHSVGHSAEAPGAPETGYEGLELQAVVAFAAAAISKRTGTCDCGISVVSSRGVHDTIASTSDVPARFDWLEHKLGQGPGLDPAQDDAVVCSPDLTIDGRWPELGTLCESVVGIRSLMRIGIPVAGGGRAAMSFYSSGPAAFDAGHLVRASRFARFATRSVQQEIQNRESTDLEAAGGGNRIASSLGVVMGRYRVTSAQAFEMLRDSAEALQVGVLDLAIEVILTGRLPAKRIGNARRDRRALQAAAATH